MSSNKTQQINGLGKALRISGSGERLGSAFSSVLGAKNKLKRNQVEFCFCQIEI